MLVVAAPSFARLLKPDELARLRRTTIDAARRVQDKSLRGGFGAVAVALAEPRAPLPTQTAPGSSEIALESEGRGYRVTGRINDAQTVTFVVDTGATYVALPQGCGRATWSRPGRSPTRICAADAMFIDRRTANGIARLA